MRYRPEGWKRCIEVRDDKKRYTSKDLNTTYEAGADAILEAIWKMAEESPAKTFTFDTRVTNVFEVTDAVK